MRAEDILDAMGQLCPAMVAQAHEPAKPRRPRWQRWAGIAAAFVLCAGLGSAVLLLFGGAGAGGGSQGDPLTYMSYEGPVLPLDVLQGGENLTAERHITLDFAPYTSRTEYYEGKDGRESYESYNSEADITDGYILYNPTDGEILAMVCYPYVSDLRELEDRPLTLTVNGVPVQAQLAVGPYAGGFEGAWGSDEAGSLNIAELDNWQGFAALLADGSYRQAALAGWTLPTDPVTVYKLDRYVYTADAEATNPTLQFQCTVDPAKTTILSYNINSWRWDPDAGWYGLGTTNVKYRPQVDPARQHKDPAYIIAVGEDVAEYTLQGYRDGGCDEGEELDDLTAQVTRYETTLDKILIEMARRYLAGGDWELQYGVQPKESQVEQIATLAAWLMETHGPLTENGAERYDTGALEDLFSESWRMQRVLYYSFPVVVPAGGSVQVSAAFSRDASIDFVGKNREREGYELMTTLGSTLTFTRQTATLLGADQITLLDQNFGFDPAAGVTTVALDLAQPHYWLHVKKHPSETE